MMAALWLVVLAAVAVSPWLGHKAAVRWRLGQLTHPAPPVSAAGLAVASGSAPRLDIPTIVELIGTALSAGASVPRALQATGAAIRGPDGVGLQHVAAALGLGAPWAEAWALAPARLHQVSAALHGAWQDGAAPTEALRVASEDIRRSQQEASAQAVGALGVKLVLPLGLCFLPAFVLMGLVPVLLALGIGLIGSGP